MHWISSCQEEISQLRNEFQYLHLTPGPPDSYFINADHYSVKKSAAILFTFDKGQSTRDRQRKNAGKHVNISKFAKAPPFF